GLSVKEWACGLQRYPAVRLGHLGYLLPESRNGTTYTRTEQRAMQPSAPRGRLVAVLVILCLGVGIACSSSPAAPSPRAGTPPPGSGGNAGPGGPAPTGATVKVVGVGDIGMCGSASVARTAALVANLEGLILLAGDIAYMHGTMANFRDCFE